LREDTKLDLLSLSIEAWSFSGPIEIEPHRCSCPGALQAFPSTEDAFAMLELRIAAAELGEPGPLILD
jgi:hypothetical protein